MDFSEKLLELYVLDSTIVTRSNHVISDIKLKILCLLHQFGTVKSTLLLSKLGMYKSNLARNCTELVESGFITWESSEEDSRCKLYSITKNGEKLLYLVKLEISKNFNSDDINPALLVSCEKITKLLNKKI